MLYREECFDENRDLFHAFVLFMAGPLAVAAIEAAPLWLVMEGTEFLIEETTGIPVILSPVDIAEYAVKKTIKEGIEKGVKKSGKEVFDQGSKQLTKSQKRAIEGLEEQIKIHKKRLKEYKENPEALDNKGFLKGVSKELREKIIKTRIKSLEDQIKTFEKDIKDIESGVKKVLEKKQK